MPWIESHIALARHPKTLRLARRLNLSVPAVLGHLHLLWYWALEYVQDGDLSKFDADEVAAACMWEGDPDEFRAALTGAGFVDESGAIHDWNDYAGRLIERRQENAEKQRLWRNRHRGDTSELRNQPHNSDVTVTLPLRSGATVPNLTKPLPTPNGVGAVPSLPAERVPSKPIERTPAHGAVVVVRDAFHFRPDELQRATIMAAIRDEPGEIDRWRRCCEEWKLRGFNVRNLTGPLEWFADGEPPPRPHGGKLNGKAPPTVAASSTLVQFEKYGA